MRQDRLLEIVGRIYQRPETWNQKRAFPERGGPACVLCHAARAAGVEPSAGEVSRTFDAGMEWLGLSPPEAEWVWLSERTLPELIHFATTGERP